MKTLETFWHDVRFSGRMLRKNPGFTAVAVLVLGIGIGATTAIFSIVDEVLLRPLPYAEAERLVLLQDHYPLNSTPISYPQFLFWKDQHQIFDYVVTYYSGSAGLTGLGEPEQLRTLNISADLLTALGLSPVAGRSFLTEEEPRNATPVVMLTNTFWKSHFNSDPGVIGRKLTLNDRVYTVVGIMPESFHLGRTPDVVFPLRLDTESAPLHLNFLPTILRLRAGMNLVQAKTAIDAILPDYKKTDTNLKNISLTPYQEFLVGDSRPVLLVLLGAVLAVLLIACTNTANLLLARAAGREKEIAVRISLGCGRMRLARQLLTESLMLGMIGGTVGVLMAWASLGGVTSLLARQLPREITVRLDYRVLVFAAAVSLLTGIAFGLVPALQILRRNLHHRLKQGGWQAGGAGGGRRLRQSLVVLELAFSLVLLAMAGLLMRSVIRLANVEKGFSTDHVLTMSLQPSPVRYSDPNTELNYVRQISERVKTLPGVRSAGLIYMIPLSGANTNGNITIEEHQNDPGKRPNATKQYLDADYFQTMRIPLLQGRFFASNDTPDSPAVVIINQTFARRYFLNEDPIGKHIDVNWGPPGWSEIVGVVGDTKLDSLAAPAWPTTYMLYSQSPSILKFLGMNLVVRTSQEPLSAVQSIRSQIHQLDPNQPIANIKTMDDVLSEYLVPQRAPMWLIGVFSGIALFLAAIGIYGVLSYFVLQRRQEIGVRMALGAQRMNVLRLILGEGARLIGIGVVIGIAAAFVFTRALTRLLFGIRPDDLLTFLAVSLLLGLLALLACAAPALRATQVDPLIVLRSE